MATRKKKETVEPLVIEEGSTTKVKLKGCTHLYLRNRPSGDILTILSEGSDISVTDISGDWASVVADGMNGFCMVKFLQKVSE